MNLIVSKAALVTALLLGAGCIAYTSSFQSSFFSRFSLRELVERNKSHRGLNCSTSGGGGGVGGGTGSVGRKESHFHKVETFSCQINDDSAEQFDEGGFIAALKQSVEADLNHSKAKIGSDKLDARSFYFEYTVEDVRGRVEISGRKDMGNYYSLKADVDEKTGEAK
ncbi:MAG TPA: hypothetical protein VMZ30_04105 [Pyrinomonadaceae bacterium]|nr:hypothetical protein [Pyrinomonadaceae bacterium]